jgi:hypothetical protein
MTSVTYGIDPTDNVASCSTTMGAPTPPVAPRWGARHRVLGDPGRLPWADDCDPFGVGNFLRPRSYEKTIRWCAAVAAKRRESSAQATALGPESNKESRSPERA